MINLCLSLILQALVTYTQEICSINLRLHNLQSTTIDLHIAVGYLVVAFVVFHIQGHVANLALETCFVPKLKVKKLSKMKHTQQEGLCQIRKTSVLILEEWPYIIMLITSRYVHIFVSSSPSPAFLVL